MTENVKQNSRISFHVPDHILLSFWISLWCLGLVVLTFLWTAGTYFVYIFMVTADFKAKSVAAADAKARMIRDVLRPDGEVANTAVLNEALKAPEIPSIVDEMSERLTVDLATIELQSFAFVVFVSLIGFSTFVKFYRLPVLTKKS